jgi:hypothetical protein
MNNVDVIRQAIASRQSLRAAYRGHLRDFSPHILGRTNGEWRVLGFQFGGFSSKGPVFGRSNGNWKCFDVDVLEELVVIDQTWIDPPTRAGRQTCVEDIDVQARSEARPRQAR